MARTLRTLLVLRFLLGPANLMGFEMTGLRKFFDSDEAIAVTEYGLLVALIAIALIAVVTIFGSNISAWFSTKTGQITTV